MEPAVERYKQISHKADVVFYLMGVVVAAFALLRLFTGTMGDTGTVMWIHISLASVGVLAGLTNFVFERKLKKLGYRKRPAIHDLIEEDRASK